jgi:hypothetical protein
MRIRFSAEIVAVLRDVLNGSIDFDKEFKNSYQQETLFESNNESLTFEIWYDKLRSITVEKRLKIQQALRDCDDLYDRIYKAMISATSSQETLTLVQPSLPRQIAEAAWYMNDFLAASLKYLGPLRDAPKPLYPLAPAADPYDVGLRGEHTASILDLHKNKKIKYIPSSNFRDPIVNRNTVTRSLETAVIDWLQYL